MRLRRLYLFVGFHILFLFGYSQCWDIRDESVNRIKQYYTQNQFDSIDLIITKWNSKCEMNEELFRLSILNAIQTDRSILPYFDNNSIGYLRSYETLQTESLLPHYHALSYAQSSEVAKLNQLTKNWASMLLLKENDLLKNSFLKVYSSENSQHAWNELMNHQFPNKDIQKSFDSIIHSSNNPEDYLSSFVGLFCHTESASQALEFGFAYDRISYDKTNSFGGALRFGPTNQIGLKYEGEEHLISTNSLFLFYDYGKYVRREKLNYQFSLSVSYSAYTSDFGVAEKSKKIVSVIGFGVSAGIDFNGNKPDKWGLFLRYVPINIIPTNDVAMNASFLTLGIKHKILKSEISRRLLHPIGYFD